MQVHDLPVRDVLFNLARDAGLELELHPEVRGAVTLTAIDQPLPKILQRLARQADLRIEQRGAQLTVLPDVPHWRSYAIDYVNLARRSVGTVSVATEIATTGVGAVNSGKGSPAANNNSTTTVTQESTNQFWDALVTNIRGVLGIDEKSSGAILANRESALLTVFATERRHEEVKRLIDHLLLRAQRQVLIEATVVEVELSDRFQAGVDWSIVDNDSGVSINQQLIGATLAQPPVTTLTIDKPSASNLLATIKMLEQFGHLKVLSSPKVMALNNQTAMLKVVDNRVYFTIDVDIQTASANNPEVRTFETHVHTVPVGFIMAVTPQIADNDLVSLNVRPTISRILGYVRDPNPALAEAGVVSEIPEIQVREIESVLKVASGQTAVLGGLMQDSLNNIRRGVPVLVDIPVLGNLFSFRDDETRKTELVVFLRPTVIRSAGIEGDLRASKD